MSVLTQTKEYPEFVLQKLEERERIQLEIYKSIYSQPDPVKILSNNPLINGQSLVNPNISGYLSNWAGNNHNMQPNVNIAYPVDPNYLHSSKYDLTYTLPDYKGIKLENIPDITRNNWGILKVEEEKEAKFNQEMKNANRETQIEIAKKYNPTFTTTIANELQVPQCTIKLQDFDNGQPKTLDGGQFQITPVLSRQVMENMIKTSEAFPQNQRSRTALSSSITEVRGNSSFVHYEQNENLAGANNWIRERLNQIAVAKFKDPLFIQIKTACLNCDDSIKNLIEETFNQGMKVLTQQAVVLLLDGTVAYLLEEAMKGIKIDNLLMKGITDTSKKRLKRSYKALDELYKLAGKYYKDLVDLNEEYFNANKVLIAPDVLATIGMAVRCFYHGVDSQGKFRIPSLNFMN